MKVYSLNKKDGFRETVYGLIVEIENNINPNMPSKKYYLLTGANDGYEFNRIASIGNFTEDMEKKKFNITEITDSSRLFAQCVSIVSSCLDGSKSISEGLVNDTFTSCYQLEKIDYDLLNEEIKNKCLSQIKQ